MQFASSIINWVIAALVFLGIVHVGLYSLSIYLRFRSERRDGQHETEKIIRALADDVSGAILRLWLFARPIVQLVLVLFVVFWFTQSVLTPEQIVHVTSVGDIKTVLAFFVIGAFCVAAFLSDSPASWLKDLALVVIGFYFGTKAGP